MNVTIKTFLNILLALLLSLTFAQCSSDEEKELKEPVETDQAADEAEKDDYEEQDSDDDSGSEEAEEAEEPEEEADYSASADVLGDMQSIDPSESEDDTAVTMDPVDQGEANSPDPLTSVAPVAEPQMEAAAGSGEVDMAPQPTGWRVWYVKSDQATTYRDTSAKESSGSYSKGESLLLKVEGQWAMLQDGRYLKASALSQKPVSRIRKAGAWR